MSIEEKAKAYDEAYKKVAIRFGSNVADKIFLKESEDEKIRKAIIEHFADSHSSTYPYKGFTREQILAWLEKQGDANKEYWRGYREGKKEILDKYSELEKQGEQKPYGQKEECLDCQFNYASECEWSCELKRNEQKPAAWSKEDKINLEKAIWYVENPAPMVVKDSMLVEWLKSLKDRVQPKQELNESGKILYNRTIGLLKQYANSDNEVKKQSALSCINWLKSVIKNEKTIKYKIGDKVRFYSNGLVFTISDIDEANERYISPSGDYISFYEELISAKGILNKDDIKCGDYLTTENGTVIKVHDVDENEYVHHFYKATEMTEDGGDISSNFMYYCAILSDCRRATQEEIDFLEKWVAHKKYVWVEDNVSPDDEEDD